MRWLVGALILAGALIQGGAHFVNSNGYALWDGSKASLHGFVSNGDFTVAAIALAAAAIAIFATGARTVAAFATGVAVLAVIAWATFGFSGWVYGGSSTVYWNGLLGLSGAILAGVGAVIGWSVGFETRRYRDAAAPGWYPDPSGQGQRWWDGAQWTTHTTT